MFKKLIFLLTKIGVDYIIKNDSKSLNKLSSPTIIKLESLGQALFNSQANISAKRLQLLTMHMDLINMMEPMLFRLLAETNDQQQKTTLTHMYGLKINLINAEVIKHQEMVEEYTNIYNELTKNKENNI